MGAWRVDLKTPARISWRRLGGNLTIEAPNPTPEVKSTKVKRCTVFRENLITENANLTVPGELIRRGRPNPDTAYAEPFEEIEYLLQLQYVSEHREEILNAKGMKVEGQPAPPPQETMPEPCKEVPKNPLCP